MPSWTPSVIADAKTYASCVDWHETRFCYQVFGDVPPLLDQRHFLDEESLHGPRIAIR